MFLNQLFNESSLADQMMALAKSRGMNPRLAGTPEQEKQRTADMMAQRAKDREAQAQQSAQADASNLESLKAEYQQMKASYESLGGSNWQYADREQNLSDSERRARNMEPELNRLAARIAAAEKSGVAEAVAGPENCWPGYRKVGTKPGTGKNAGKRVNDCEKISEEGVAEGEPGNLEHELNRQEYNDDKIGGRYDPDEFDQMVARLGQKAKEQERKHGPVDLAKLAQRLRDIK